MSGVLSPKWSSYITSPLLKTQGSVEVDEEKFKSWRLCMRTKKRIILTQKDMNSVSSYDSMQAHYGLFLLLLLLLSCTVILAI